MKILLLAGGAWYHDQPAHRRALMACLDPHFDVHMTHYPERALDEDLSGFDVIADYTSWWEPSEAQCQALLAAVANGTGFACLHPATASWMNSREYHDMVGGTFVFHDPNKLLRVVTEPSQHYKTREGLLESSAITEGIGEFEVQDELYVVDGDMTRWRILARSQGHPVVWTKPYGKGRVFSISLGHDERALGHPSVQQLYVRGIQWAGGRLD